MKLSEDEKRLKSNLPAYTGVLSLESLVAARDAIWDVPLNLGNRGTLEKALTEILGAIKFAREVHLFTPPTCETAEKKSLNQGQAHLSEATEILEPQTQNEPQA